MSLIQSDMLHFHDTCLGGVRDMLIKINNVWANSLVLGSLHLYIFSFFILSNAMELTEAWNEELAFGGVAAQWAEDFEAELERMEAELDGVHIQSDETVSIPIYMFTFDF